MKTNHPETTLREPQPKAEKVTEVDSEENAGAAIKAAARQNENDEKEGSVNVVPSGRDFPTRVHGHK